ncbi:MULTISPECIES: acyl-CoA thioesterase domain-containing protein [Streptomyces]|uniref:acyl-CoA thioesterase domain-containing protein n=1 Tax=Streptomyces TaxID=1883 RepID=UPI001F0BDE95|nr:MULTISPECIES: acyl-CoA thioesterase domain-containing protein [Streptomyces]
MGKTAERLGEGRPLASVADDEVGEALELLCGASAVNTWNSRRASVLVWLGWCRERGYEGPAVPARAKRLAVPDSETPARSRIAIDRLIARREVHLREKTLWRMLYVTAGRSEEILGVNIKDLDFAGCRCPVDLVAGQNSSPLASYVALVDTANGIAVRQPPTAWMFPNVHLTIHLHRQPEGRWTGLDTTVTFGPTGQGVTTTVLHDVTGPTGHAQQILTVRPQPAGDRP